MLRCAIHWAVFTTEGPPNDIWTTEQPPAAPAAAPGQALQGNPIDPNVFQSRAEDINLVRGQGFEVNDDNDPAPENIPQDAAADPIKACMRDSLGGGMGLTDVLQRIHQWRNHHGSTAGLP